MNIIQIIEKKRDGQKLSEAEIRYFVNGYAVEESITQYQASALLMAIYFNGMDDEELGVLTDAMIKTGRELDFSKQDGIFVDKHSTGGVGDKVSIVLGPILAACGLKLAKMSGRGLGFTGGTLDKLESIEGYRIEISEKEFFKQVNEIGIAIIGQSNDMVLADKKMYALRDVTGTIESIPLIASSIMSKKIAAGAQTILLDVKYGDGAFMKTLDAAKELAHRMQGIGYQLGRQVRCEVTSMQNILGVAVGNALEIKEAIEALKGNFETDFEYIIKHSGATLLVASGLYNDEQAAIKRIEQVINDGSALAIFGKWIAAQGGNKQVVNNYELLNISRNTSVVKAARDGFIGKIHVKDIGILSAELGAGRLEITDKIDHSVGIEVFKKVGDKVQKGEALCTLYCKADETRLNDFIQKANDCFVITGQKVPAEPLIAAVI